MGVAHSGRPQRTGPGGEYVNNIDAVIGKRQLEGLLPIRFIDIKVSVWQEQEWGWEWEKKTHEVGGFRKDICLGSALERESVSQNKYQEIPRQ